MTTTLKTALGEGIAELNKAGIDTAELDASVLLCHCTQTERLTLLTEPNLELSENQYQAYRALLARRAKHEPVAYILGYKEFWSHRFKVAPGVLIPRPDTETLVATLLALLPGQEVSGTIAELGVGSGAVLLSVLKECPKLTGFGVDLHDKPLEITAENARLLGVEGRVTLLQGSWAEPVPDGVNIIISNPPYIEESAYETLQSDVRDYEPQEALVAGADGLAAYRALLSTAYAKLAGGGLLLLEIGSTQAEAVLALLSTESGWAEQRVFKDLAGRPRVVAAIKAR